jgi:hypothetical protein
MRSSSRFSSRRLLEAAGAFAGGAFLGGEYFGFFGAIVGSLIAFGVMLASNPGANSDSKLPTPLAR